MISNDHKDLLMKKYGPANPIPVGMAGYVMLLDVMGDDSDIAATARTSYQKGTTKKRNDDKLINYLYKSRHTSPFEQCSIRFQIKLPKYIALHFLRHRTAKVNEYSLRYSLPIEDIETYGPKDWRSQDDINRQGSLATFSTTRATILENLPSFVDSSIVDSGASNEEVLTDIHTKFNEIVKETYNLLIKAGVCREQARAVLPSSQYTVIVFNMDLKNLLDFIALRADSHAQKETQDFANAMAQIVKEWCPIAYEAFEDYRKFSVTLSQDELSAFSALSRDEGCWNIEAYHVPIFEKNNINSKSSRDKILKLFEEIYMESLK